MIAGSSFSSASTNDLGLFKFHCEIHLVYHIGIKPVNVYTNITGDRDSACNLVAIDIIARVVLTLYNNEKITHANENSYISISAKIYFV